MFRNILFEMKSLLIFSFVLYLRQCYGSDDRNKTIWIDIWATTTPPPFITVGKYPSYEKFDINLIECGLKYRPEVYKYIYGKCFRNEFPMKIIADIDGIRKIDSKDVMNRILFGHETTYYEAPYVVIISMKKFFITTRGHCTGVLITFEWVLSAAHCFIKGETNVIKVGGNRRTGVEERSVVKFLTHPGYKIGQKENGIALAKVDTPFTRHLSDLTYGINFVINTICLPESGKTVNGSEHGTFYGFGYNGESFNPPNRLQRGEMSFRKCDSDTNLCSYASHDSKTSRACTLDSGGPIVQFTDRYRSRVFLRGINWFYGPTSVEPTNCSQLLNVSYFISVSERVNWILDTISNH